MQGEGKSENPGHWPLPASRQLFALRAQVVLKHAAQNKSDNQWRKGKPSEPQKSCHTSRPIMINNSPVALFWPIYAPMSEKKSQTESDNDGGPEFYNVRNQRQVQD